MITSFGCHRDVTQWYIKCGNQSGFKLISASYSMVICRELNESFQLFIVSPADGVAAVMAPVVTDYIAWAEPADNLGSHEMARHVFTMNIYSIWQRVTCRSLLSVEAVESNSVFTPSYGRMLSVPQVVMEFCTSPNAFDCVSHSGRRGPPSTIVRSTAASFIREIEKLTGRGGCRGGDAGSDFQCNGLLQMRVIGAIVMKTFPRRLHTATTLVVHCVRLKMQVRLLSSER